jgi:uncharacterized RDD family membrane protein YckC
MTGGNITFEGGYVGFWARVLASLIDSILAFFIIIPVVLFVYGKDYFAYAGLFRGPVDMLMNVVFPAVAIILFWLARSATPGKMVISAKIVDARTGDKPSTRQLIGRYLGYYVSMLPFFFGFFLGFLIWTAFDKRKLAIALATVVCSVNGFIWVAFDKRKQGWHDKLARTVVVYGKRRERT